MAQKEVTLKITVDGKELDVAKASVEQFDKAYTAAAQKLSTLKVGSEEWKKLNSELENSKKAFDQTKDAANGADGKFKSLRSQIRETTVALQALADQGKEGSSEFKALSDKLDDLGDAQKRVAFQSGQIEDKLSALPGPLGKIGQGFKAAKDSVDTFGKTLTISLGIIGLLVAAFFAIKDALGKTKEGTQLLAQATTAFNKVLSPLFAILEKIGTIVLPIVIKGFEMLGSVIGGVAEFFGIKTEKINEVTASLEKNNEAANKLAEEEKARLEKEKALQEERTKKLKEEAEKRKQINEEAEKVMNDARLALMNEKDREIEVAAQKHKENLKKLRAAGNRGITLEEERYNKEILTINQKYNLIIENELKSTLVRVRSNAMEGYDVLIKNLQLYHEKRKKLNLTSVKDDLEVADEIKNIELEKLEATQLYRRNDLADAQKAQKEKLIAAGATNADLLEQQKIFNLETKSQEQNFTLELENLELERQSQKRDLIQQAANDRRKLEFEVIQATINDLDKLNAKRDYDFEEDISRNKLKIEELKKQQAIEEEAAKGQADVLFKIKRDYGDKINAIEVENTKIKKAEEEQRYQIALTYAQAVQQVGQILQAIAGENKDLALLGLAIEKAAAVATVTINTIKNASKYGFITPMGIAEMAAGAVGVAAIIVSYIKGVAAIKGANSSGSSSGAGASAGGGEAYNGLGRNYGDGGMIEGPRHAGGGVMINAEGGEAVMTRGAVTMFAPLLSALNQAGGGTSFNSGVTSAGASYDNPKTTNANTEMNPMVIKTYVVSNDMTSEQEKQSRLKDLSTL